VRCSKHEPGAGGEGYSAKRLIYTVVVVERNNETWHRDLFMVTVIEEEAQSEIIRFAEGG